jgi:hypothetical protein
VLDKKIVGGTPPHSEVIVHGFNRTTAIAWRLGKPEILSLGSLNNLLLNTTLRLSIDANQAEIFFAVFPQVSFHSSNRF